jgi:hypothetical protein
VLAALAEDSEARAALAGRLRGMSARLDALLAPDAGDDDADLETVSDEELFELLDEELEAS